MSRIATTVPADTQLLGGILRRIHTDLSMMLGHELEFGAPAVERQRARPIGKGTVHISFKLGFQDGSGETRHGCLLVPLAEAITMACFLLMIAEENVAARRTEPALDATQKDALLEIGSMIGGAANTALAELGLAGWSVRTEGCQGVRADVRPAFPYEDGAELLVAELSAALAPYPSFRLCLMVPPLG